MLPYFEPEIVPNVLEPGVRRIGLEEDDISGNCRAVVEAQMISMRIHAKWMGVSTAKIYATGGASGNRDILQVMADVQGCPVYRFETTNSAALGAALRAAHGYLLESGNEIPWDEVVSGFADPVSGSAINPAPDAREIYAELIRKYEACEAEGHRRTKSVMHSEIPLNPPLYRPGYMVNRCSGTWYTHLTRGIGMS